MKPFKYIVLVVLAASLLFGCSSDKPMSRSGGSSSKQLSSENQQKMDFYFFEAVKERNMANYETAAKLFSQVLQYNGNNAAASYELANIREYQHLNGEALVLAKKAASIDPDNVWYHLLLAHLYEKNSQYSNAAETYEHIVKTYPEKGEYYFEWASTLLLDNKVQEAIKVYEQIEEKMGINEDLSLNKYNLYRTLEQPEKAILEIEKLIKAFPSEGRYYGVLAEYYQETGQTEKALESYEKILEIDPDNEVVHLSLSEYYRLNGDRDKAGAEMEKAFENPNLDIETKRELLINYFITGDTASWEHKQAYRLLDQMLEAHPKEATAYAIYGDFLFRDGNLELAREQYRKAIVFDNSKFFFWNQILRIDAQLQDFSAMLEESEESLNLFPSQPSLYLYNGISHIQKEQYSEAVDVLNSGKALVIEDDRLLSQFYNYLGDAYHKDNKNEESDEAFENVLKIDPYNATVLNNYSYYLSTRKKDLEKAQRMSLRSNELEPGNPSFQDTYGWIMYELGDFEEAEVWLGKAMSKQGKGNVTILEHYGDTQFKLNNLDKAMEYWGKAKDASSSPSDELLQKLKDRKLND